MACLVSDITGLKEIKPSLRADDSENTVDEKQQPVDENNNVENIVDEEKPPVDENNNVDDQQLARDANLVVDVDEKKTARIDAEKDVETFVDRLSQLSEAGVDDLRKLADVSSELCAAGKKVSKADHMKHFSVSTEVS